MANNFKGYLLKAIKTGKTFPAQYMLADSWSSTPSQREELKAYRDDNTRDLTRITAAGKKTAWSFSTRPDLRLDQKMEVQQFFTDAEEDADQRKVQLEFWNDEKNDYQTGYFYRPNTEFKIKQYSVDDIIYNSLTIEGVEY